MRGPVPTGPAGSWRVVSVLLLKALRHDQGKEDAAAACGMGYGAIGLVFAESPRRVSPECGPRHMLLASLPGPEGGGLRGRGARRGPAHRWSICGLDLVQLHGGEDAGEALRFRRAGRSPRCGRAPPRTWRASRSTAASSPCSWTPGTLVLAGGTGRACDWELAARAALSCRVRRRADLPQARGPLPHRRPQDQQRARAGAAGGADGEAPDHRRDRGRAARRGHRHRLREVRAGVHRLHGRRGHGAPAAQRRADAAARRGGPPGHQRLADPEGRHQRGHPRLGLEPRGHVLHHRERGRAAPVPDDGPGLPPGDRGGDPPPAARDGGPETPDAVVACVGGGSNAIGMFYPFLEDEGVRLIGVEAAGRGAGRGGRAAARRHPHPREPRRAPRGDELPAAGRGRAGPAGALDLGRAGLPRRRPRARLPSSAVPRAFSPPWRAPTPWPAP
jgi:hypothetical protein